MRSDMAKVIVERPRYKGREPSFNARKSAFERRSRDRTDHEVLAKTMPTRMFGTRCLNENLKPLLRFLRRRVGKPWNDVHAELSARLAPRRAIDAHVLDHVKHFVYFTRREGARLWLVDGDGRYVEPFDEPALWRRALFYVCCDTRKLLCRAAPRRKKKPAPTR